MHTGLVVGLAIAGILAIYYYKSTRGAAQAQAPSSGNGDPAAPTAGSAWSENPMLDSPGNDISGSGA